MNTFSVEQLVGQNLGNSRIEQMLGRGRLSAVFLARQAPQGRTVAITVFLVPEQFSPQARQRFSARFLKEAQALKALEHPYILPVYEYGEQYGFPFLTTPYMTTGSLIDVLGMQGRCKPAYVKKVLVQIAQALDFAHSQGVLHQALKPENILLHPEQRIQIAGFGLINLLQMRGIEYSDFAYAHLLSIAGTFLGSPEYVAPEFVQGQYVDGRSDIYALGIMLYELLSGELPFKGKDPIEVAQRHVNQPIPSIRTLVPDLPESLDAVLQRAYSKNPMQRYQTATELATAFSEAVNSVSSRQRHYIGAGSVETSEQNIVIASPRVLAATTSAASNYIAAQAPAPVDEDNFLNSGPTKAAKKPAAQNYLPPATGIPTAPNQGGSNWQLTPPVITGRVPAVNANSGRPRQDSEPVRKTIPLSENGPRRDNSSALPTPERASTKRPGSAAAARNGEPGQVNSVSDLDAFAWWSGVPHTAPPQANLTLASAARKGTSQPRPQAPLVVKPNAGSSISQAWGMYEGGMLQDDAFRSRKVGRRKVVAALAGGSAAVVALGIGGVSLARYMGKHNVATTTAQMNQPQATTKNPPAKNNGTGNTNKGQQPQTKGKVIATNLPVNSAQTFTNPADGKGAALVHLQNGNYVAFETACTHQGVTVKYDPATQKFVCPLHFAVFDPANQASVVSGPAPTPLPPVTIHVQANGTVTA